VLLAALIVVLLVGIKKTNQSSKRSQNGRKDSKGDGSKRQGKGNVDALFWKRVGKLVGHVVPSWNC